MKNRHTIATVSVAMAAAPAASARDSHADLNAELRELVRMPGGPAGAIVVVQRPDGRTVYTAVEHDGSAPSTLVGQAITETISPGHVYTLPAAPTTDQDG